MSMIKPKIERVLLIALAVVRNLTRFYEIRLRTIRRLTRTHVRYIHGEGRRVTLGSLNFVSCLNLPV